MLSGRASPGLGPAQAPPRETGCLPGALSLASLPTPQPCVGLEPQCPSPVLGTPREPQAPAGLGSREGTMGAETEQNRAEQIPTAEPTRLLPVPPYLRAPPVAAARSAGLRNAVERIVVQARGVWGRQTGLGPAPAGGPPPRGEARPECALPPAPRTPCGALGEGGFAGLGRGLCRPGSRLGPSPAAL